MDDRHVQICLEWLRLVFILMPYWPLQPFECLGPDCDKIVRHRYANVVELTMASEIRFDEIPTSCGCDDLRVSTSKKLRDTIDMVVVAMCAYNVVLPFALRIERLVVVIFDGIVLEIWP